MTTLALAPNEVNSSAVEFLPEVEVDATFDASYALWMEEEQADEEMWSDEFADAMAARHADDELTDRIANGSMPW